MQLTDEQEAAVFAPVSDILVTAAAGSGKTQVLTGRIIDRIKKGADVSRLLVITFTNAAAAEMRERISKSLSDAFSDESDDKKKSYLKRQLSLSETADISTLHSFCLKLLRKYFHELGLDPSFTLLNNYDRKIMLSEALEETVNFFYDTENADFIEFSSLVSSPKNDMALTEMIASVRDYAMSDPFPEKWLRQSKETYFNMEKGKDPFSRPLMKKALEYTLDASKCLKKATELLESEPALNTLYDKVSVVSCAVDKFLSSSPSWDDAFNFFSGIKFPAFSGGKKDADPELKALASSYYQSAKKLITESAAFLIDLPYDESYKNTVRMTKYVAVLSDAAAKSIELYANKKAEKNVLDFNDLEHFALKLLTVDSNPNEPSATAREVQNLYDEIYVDEYQDINDIQETLINLISGGKPNVFMVGDMKQSIYRFRHTDPEKIFGKKAEEFKDYKLCDSSDKRVRISLTRNFRSSPEIISDVNTVFKTLMSKKVGGVSYTGTEVLRYENGVYKEKSDYPSSSFKFIAERGKSTSELKMAEADFLATRIKSIVESELPVYDKSINDYRPIRYGDIAVLLRAAKKRADYYEEALRAHSIPVLYEKESAFFDSTEIMVLISLLRIIDNPLQDIDLIAVLRSPLFNFDTNLLANLALLKKPYFYNAVLEASEGENGDKRCRYFINLLKKWRKEASLSGVYEFTSRLIAELDYTSYVSSMPDSATHIANLNLFLSFAKKSDASQYKGLFNFLKYIESLYNSGSIEPDSSLDTDVNAVRIMTIHKSKGLEFPFVFLCNCAERFNQRDATGNLYLDRDLGISVNSFYPDRTVITTPMVKLSVDKIKDASLSEEMRVLYVALTRAREHLEIISTVNFSDKTTDDEIYDKVFEKKRGSVLLSEIRFASSYSDWLKICAREKGVPKITICPTASNDEKTTDDDKLSINPLPPDEDMIKHLGWSYPKRDILTAKNKYSVSELKSGTAFSEDNAKPFFGHSLTSLRKPAYLNSDKVFTSMQKGSIMHYVAEHLDFNSLDVAAQIKNMNLTEKEREAVDINAIISLIKSPIGERIRQSKKVYRESPFTFKKALSQLTPSISSDAETLIQGIIDCYFFEDDGIVLLDYKTDRNIDNAEASRRYKEQLTLYSEALEKKHKLPVKEMYLYMFETGKFIKL